MKSSVLSKDSVRNFEHAVVFESAIAMLALRDCGYGVGVSESVRRRIVRNAIIELGETASPLAASDIPQLPVNICRISFRRRLSRLKVTRDWIGVVG